jgi:hypothetical protein
VSNYYDAAIGMFIDLKITKMSLENSKLKCEDKGVNQIAILFARRSDIINEFGDK